jgi:hypothetical protein
LGHGGSRKAGTRGGLIEQSEITGEIFKLKPPESTPSLIHKGDLWSKWKLKAASVQKKVIFKQSVSCDYI